MYEHFYNFEKPPFSLLPDPDALFLSPQHRRALSLLEYGLLSQAGFCVIAGDVGSGKTTLLRALFRRIQADMTVGLINNTKCSSFEELLRWVLFAFEIEYRGKDKVELYDSFVEFLIEEYGAGRRVALVIDEAQHLSVDLLEQLRMMSNVNTEQGQVLQMVLVGQPGLWDLLRRPELRQFAQRIALDYSLGPLEGSQVGPYIRHRLATAGGDPDLFQPETYPRIWAETGGVPRLINLICDTALVYGYTDQAPRIGLQVVEEVLDDKQGGLSPLKARWGREGRPERSGPSEDRQIHQERAPKEPTSIERLFNKQ